MSGPVGILGCPGSGKTTLARRLASDIVARTGAPLLVIDTGAVENFTDIPHAQDVDDLIEMVWTDGVHAAYTPKDPEEFETVCGAIIGGRNVVVLIDELKNVIPPGHPMRANCRRILSEWRRILAGAFVTSQLYHDSGRALQGLASEWYFFRMLGPEDQRDIRADHGIEPEVIANLPSAKECALTGRREAESYIYRKVGF